MFGVLLAVALAVAQNELVARACSTDVEEARLAACVGGVPVPLCRQHAHRRRRGIVAFLQGEAALAEAWQVDDGKFQALAGVDGHDAQHLRRALLSLSALFAPALALLAQTEQDLEVFEEVADLLLHVWRGRWLLAALPGLLLAAPLRLLKTLVVAVRELQQGRVVLAGRTCSGTLVGQQVASQVGLLQEIAGQQGPDRTAA